MIEIWTTSFPFLVTSKLVWASNINLQVFVFSYLSDEDFSQDSFVVWSTSKITPRTSWLNLQNRWDYSVFLKEPQWTFPSKSKNQKWYYEQMQVPSVHAECSTESEYWAIYSRIVGLKPLISKLLLYWNLENTLLQVWFLFMERGGGDGVFWLTILYLCSLNFYNLIYIF